MIVVLGLPLKVAAILLGCILSMRLSVFNALGPISIPTPPTVAFTEFSHVDTMASVHPLPVSWYLYPRYVYICVLVFILCLLLCWPILFKVLTLNVAICIVCLHFSNFCCFSSVADFSNTKARALTSAGRAPILPARRAMRFIHVVWLCVLVIFRWLFFFSSIEANLIDEQQ